MEILFGFIAGIITSLGMGGGAILILLLNLFLKINQHTSQATNLIFFIPTSIVSIIMNIKNKNIDFKISKTIIFYGIIGAIIGSIFSNYLPNKKLQKIFGIFLLFISIFQIHEIYTTHIKSKNKNTNNK